jgi:TRAP-type C4-dicarboxylate transport system substrate-binding protein
MLGKSVLARTGGAAVVAAFAMAMAPLASGQQTINVTFISGYPPQATHVGGFLDYYKKALDAELAKTGKYKIDWVLAHSGQVAKPRGELEAIQSKLGDIGVLPTPAHFDRVPLYQMSYVTPFTTDDTNVLVATVEGLEKQFPQYDEAWRAVNQRSIAITANVDNYVVLSTRPLKTLADLRGLKIGAAGPNLPYVTATGATGVSALLTDWYPGLNSNLYGAVLAWPHAIGSFKLCEAAKHMFDGGLGSSSILNMTVNREWFDGQPDEVRKAILTTAPTYHKGQTELLRSGTQKALDTCQRDHGMTITVMSKEDSKAWATSLPPLGLDWIKHIEGRGLPGKAVLTAYMDNMRAAKQRVIRNWDKE